MSPLVPALSLERLSMSSAGHVLQRKGIRNNPLYTENSSGCTAIVFHYYRGSFQINRLEDRNIPHFPDSGQLGWPPAFAGTWRWCCIHPFFSVCLKGTCSEKHSWWWYTCCEGSRACKCLFPLTYCCYGLKILAGAGCDAVWLLAFVYINIGI